MGLLIRTLLKAGAQEALIYVKIFHAVCYRYQVRVIKLQDICKKKPLHILNSSLFYTYISYSVLV